MITINKNLYDYPVTITDYDFQTATGIELKIELGVEQNVEVEKWLNAAHENVYNRIYRIGGKTLKDRIINSHLEYLTRPLKRCLIAQIEYMLDANGDYGVVDGSNTNADGQLNIVNGEILKSKIVAPKVIEILKAARPNLLMGEWFVNKVGYRYTAILYTLDDVKIQVIKCKKNSRNFVTSSFMDSGKLSQGQTLTISTKDNLLSSVQAGVTRCELEGAMYLVVGIFGQDTAPIKQKTRQIKDTVLSLQ